MYNLNLYYKTFTDLGALTMGHFTNTHTSLLCIPVGLFQANFHDCFKKDLKSPPNSQVYKKKIYN